MPFPLRVIPKRDDIGEVFNGTTDNILQKTNVSHLIGLLNQFNKVSLYAHEIFTDVLSATTDTSQRIKTVKSRINKLQTQTPKYENLLISRAPNVFYDNPYPGKEYLRADSMNGLLFCREDSSNVINRRRNIAKPPTDLSALDGISEKGPCLKQFSDADFFIDEWLANEKRKREEERERRRAMKANRKTGKNKRAKTKTIQRLKRKRYDAHGNEILDDEPAEVAVKQYVLLDDTNRDFDTLLNSKKKSKKDKKPKSSPSQPPQQSPASTSLTKPKPTHQSKVSYGVPDQPMKASHVSVKSDVNGGPPPFNPLKLTQSESNSPPAQANNAVVVVPPPNPIQQQQPPPIPNGAGAPPPNPIMLTESYSQSQSKRSTLSKLRSVSGKIPLDDIVDVPEHARSPRDIYATTYQKRDLENEKLDLSNASDIIASSPKQVGPVPPKLGFLGDIHAFKKEGKLKKTEVNVNRHKPKDKRSNLLEQLRNNKVQLTSVNLRKVNKPKEEKKNRIYAAMAGRRKYFEDSSEEEESDWGSDSD